MTSEGTCRGATAVEVVGVLPPPPDLLRDVTRVLSERITMPCRIGEEPRIDVPYLSGRAQIDADGLLDRLEGLDSGTPRIVLGLTREDMGHPIFTHFFGRARHHGRAVLVSMARLAPTFYGLPDDRDLIVRRTVLEALHELGHAAGLAHCEDWGCIMRFASNVEGIDNRGTTLCDACRITVPPGCEALTPRV